HSRHCLPVYLLWKSFGGYHTPAVAWSLIQMYTDSRGHCGECTRPVNSNAFSFFDRFCHQVRFHPIGHSIGQDYTTGHIFYLAEVFKALSGSNVANVTSD